MPDISYCEITLLYHTVLGNQALHVPLLSYIKKYYIRHSILSSYFISGPLQAYQRVQRQYSLQFQPSSFFLIRLSDVTDQQHYSTNS